MDSDKSRIDTFSAGILCLPNGQCNETSVELWMADMYNRLDRGSKYVGWIIEQLQRRYGVHPSVEGRLLHLWGSDIWTWVLYSTLLLAPERIAYLANSRQASWAGFEVLVSPLSMVAPKRLNLQLAANLCPLESSISISVRCKSRRVSIVILFAQRWVLINNQVARHGVTSLKRTACRSELGSWDVRC